MKKFLLLCFVILSGYVSYSKSIDSLVVTPLSACAGTSISISIYASGYANTDSIYYYFSDNGGLTYNQATPFTRNVLVLTPTTISFNIPSNTTSGTYRIYAKDTISGNQIDTSSKPFTVSAVSVGGTVSSAQTICSGTTPANLTLSGSVGSVTRWQKASDIGFTTPTSISNTSATLTGATIGTLSANTYFRAVVKSGVCDSAYSTSVLITVTPVSVGGTAASNQSICSGSTPADINLSGYTGSILRWQKASDIAFTTPTTIAVTAATLTGPTIGALSASTYFRAVVKNGICDSAYSSSVLITVSPTSVGGTVASNQTICSGTAPADLTLSGSVGSVLRWQKASDAGFTTPVTIAVTSTTLTGATIGALSSNTYFRAVVKSGVCDSAYSSSVLITVTPVSVGGTVASAQTICSGNAPADLTLSGSVGSVTRWQKASDAAFTSPTSIAVTATTLPGATIGALSSNTYFRAVVKNGVCDSAYSTSVLITVNPVSVGGTVSSAQTICSGTQPNDLTLSGNTGSVVKWQKASDVAFTSPTDISNTTTSLTGASIGALTSNTYFRAVVQSGVCSAANAAPALITVNPVSVGGTVSSAQTICSGTQPNDLTLSGNTGAVVKWQKASDVAFSSPTDISNTSTTLTGATIGSLTSSTYFRAVVQSGVCSAANSTPVLISVNANSSGGALSAGAIVCPSSTNSTTFTLTGNTGTIVKWQESTNGGSSWSDIANTNTTYTANNITTSTLYRAVIQSGVCSAVNSATAGVFVNTNPTASFTNTTDCFNVPPTNFFSTSTIGSTISPAQQTAYNISGSVGLNMTYSWNFGDPASGASNTSTLSSPTHTFTVDSTFNVSFTVTMNTLIGAVNVASCSNTFSKSVTVNSKPKPLFTVNNSGQCINGNSFNFSNNSTIKNGSIVSYSWSFGNGNTSVVTSPSNIVYASAGTYNVKLVATSNSGCKDSTTQTITVYPKPSVSFTTNQAVQCITGNNFTFNNTSSISSGSLGYQWTFGNGNTSSQISPSNFYVLPGTYTVKLVATSLNGCKDSASQSVTVYPVPTASLTLAPGTICQGSTTTLSITITDAVAGVTTYAIGTTPGGTDITSTTTINTNGTTTTSKIVTPPAGNTTYFLTVITAPCANVSSNASVTVNPTTLGGTLSNGVVVCPNSTNSTTFNLTGQTGSVIKWQISNDDGANWRDTAVTSTSLLAKDIAVSSLFRAVIKSGLCNPVNSTTAGVFVNKAPIANFTNTIVCDNLPPTVFSNLSAAGSTLSPLQQTLYSIPGTVSTSTTYLWDFDDIPSGAANSSTLLSPTHAYSIAKSYSVKLTVTTNILVGISSSSCTNSVTNAVAVLAKPTPPTLSSSNAASVCFNQQGVNLRVDSVTGLHYRWSTANGGVIIHGKYSPNAIFDFPATGSPFNIYVTAFNAAGCQDSTKVTFSPSASIPNPPLVILTNNSKTLVCLDNQQPTFQWGYDSRSSFLGTDFPGATLQDYTSSSGFDFANRNYYVKLSSGNCTYKVYFNPPSAILSNGQNLKLDLQPNPNSGSFELNINGNAVPEEAWVTDMLGRHCGSLRLRSGTNKVNLETLPAGIYYLQIMDSNGNHQSLKFIINK